MVNRGLFLLYLFWQSTISLYASGADEPAPAGLWRMSQHRFGVRETALQQALALQRSSEESHTVLSFRQEAETPRRKSRGRAFLQSLLLPGWGQHYAQSNTMMKVFAVSEVVLWGSYLGFTTWSNWLKDDYHTFAATHAGVEVAGKPSSYFVDIGRFADIFEFNQAQLRDRDVADLYPETDEFFWRWDDDANREQFSDMRKRSDLARNRSEFAIAAILVNHLASAIHSTLAVYKFNKQLENKGLGLHLNLKSDDSDQRLSLTLVKHW